MDTKEKVRKQYKKPNLSQVKLKIEESVLADCKTVAAEPAMASRNPALCTNNACKITGS